MTLKKILPDLIAIVAFILISFAYFFPADIEGRILFQHDTSAGTGAGQEAKVYKDEMDQCPLRRYAYLPDFSVV